MKLSVCLLSLFLSLLLIKAGKAQVALDRLKTEVDLTATVASEGNQPFWMTHNRWGLLDDESANGLVRFTTRKTLDRDRFFDWGGGFSIVGRASQNSSFFLHEGYLEAAAGMFKIEAGRKKKILGETYPGLSSGSTGISRNASPIPRITLSVPNFEPVPFTDGWLEFRGHLSHGWFSNHRMARDLPEQTSTGLTDTYLHEKSFYLQTGRDTGLKLYTGLIHFTEWGGVTEDGRELPDSFDDFLRIMIASEGGQESTGIDQANALGAHYGLWDWGLTADFGTAGVHLYYQHLFTDGSGLWYRNLRDGLYGIGITDPFPGNWITGILWEFLYTKHQTGPGLPDPMAGDSPPFCEEVNCGYRFNGRDDYYNNDYYLSGWSYHTRSLGSPLLMTRAQLDRVEAGIETWNNRYFVSTRVVAHHAGLQGQLHEDLSWKLLATWNRHYGTWFGLNLGEPWGSMDPANHPEAYYFNPPLEQWFFLLESGYRMPGWEGVTIRLSLALDSGDLFNSLGGLAGIRWRLGKDS